MTEQETALLESIEQMAEDAPLFGICSMPFNVLYDQVSELIEEIHHLKSECNRLLSIR